MNRHVESLLLGRRVDPGVLLARLMLGAVFVFHGAQKVFGAFGGHGLEGFATSLERLQFPAPWPMAVVGALLELAGGLALILGLALRPMAALLAVQMLIAAFSAHSGFDARQGGMEYPLTLGVVLAGLALIGPDRWSLDSVIALSRPRAGPSAAAHSA